MAERKSAKTNKYREELEAELRRIVRVLVDEVSPYKILVFGSVATGQVRESSDIDLVVVMDTDLPFVERGVDLAKRVRSRFGIDLLVYTPEEFERLCRERSFFRDEILAKGRVLYEKRSR